MNISIHMYTYKPVVAVWVYFKTTFECGKGKNDGKNKLPLTSLSLRLINRKNKVLQIEVGS